MSKSPDAFRTISEVADELELPQHVLRFWETRFSQIKPLKRGGGRRYYRREDIDLLRGVRFFLYEEGYTIKGVQKLFRDHGPRYFADVGRGEASPRTADIAHLPQAAPEGTEIDEYSHLHRLNDEADASPLPGELPLGGSGDNGSDASVTQLSKGEVELLHSTLFELLECKRRLDALR